MVLVSTYFVAPCRCKDFIFFRIAFDLMTNRRVKNAKKTDNMAAIRSMFDQFVQCCQNAYTLNKFLTIDEMLLSFRGRMPIPRLHPKQTSEIELAK